MDNSVGMNLIALYMEFILGYVGLIVWISSKDKIFGFWRKIFRLFLIWIFVTFIFGGLAYITFGFTKVFNVVGTRYFILGLEFIISYYVIKNILLFIDDKFKKRSKSKFIKKNKTRKHS